MKTKELIRRLQEEDPTGECEIVLSDGPLFSIEKKPAYWDGPLNYLEVIDNKLNWVTTTKGNKIELGIFDLFDLADRYNGDWEKMKNHIKVDYTYLDDGKRANEFMDFAKKECDEYNEILTKIKERR